MAIINGITPADFKNQFKRDFIYASIWDEESIYNTNNVVFYELTFLYYRCLNLNVSSLPTTIADWLALADKNYILDEDIEKAFIQAGMIFNTAWFSNEDNAKMVFLYLTAHYLAIDFNLGGLSVGGNSGIITSKSVSDVPVSYAGLPKTLADNPLFSSLQKTGYGRKALDFIIPIVSLGGIGIYRGYTTPD